MAKHVLKLLIGVLIFNEGFSADIESKSGAPSNVDKQEGCGWRNPDGVGFLIEGENGHSNYGEFPWMAALLKIEKTKDNKSLNIYFGGGSLIHPGVVLTAAHLVVDKQPEVLKIRAGEWDTQTKAEIYPNQDIDVASVLIHEDYNKGSLKNNIALLFLAKPVTLAPNVGVVCLPPPQYKALPGTKCYASGWGKDKFGKQGTYSTILKKTEMPIVDHGICEKKMRETRLGTRFDLDPTFMCAGEAGKYTCKGDGGSPLVCPTETKNRYIQNGIVAWSIGCSGEPPTVLVDVAQFRDWIDDKIKNKGYDTATYSFA